MTKKLSELSIRQLFFVVTLTLIAIYVICAIATKGYTFVYSIDSVPNMLFADFFNSVYDAMKSYNETGIIYPPFINLCFRALGTIVTPFAPDALSAKTTVVGAMVFAIYVMMAALIVCWFVHSSYKGKEKTLLALILLMSSPFLYMLELGNIIIIAAMLIFPFIAWYDSEDKRLRYIAYICLALSVNIKMYPIIFALLILRRKEYREFVYFLIITAAIFFVSLLLLQDSLIDFVNNILHTVVRDFRGVGISTPVHDVCYILGNTQYYKEISYVVMAIVLALSAYITLKSKTIEKWKLVLLLSLLLCTCGTFNVAYCIVYLFIPIVMFLNTDPQKNTQNWVYFILLTLMIATLIGWRVNDEWIMILSPSINGYLPTITLVFLLCTELRAMRRTDSGDDAKTTTA